MKPTDLALGRWPGEPTLHPTGGDAVVSVSRIDFDADDYTSQLWLVRTDERGAARQLTYGWRDASPAYSPDGAFLAFVRSEPDEAGKVGDPQLWVMPVNGGEPRRLTDAPAGVEAPTWSPDSTRLAYLARDVPAGRESEVESGKQPPRRITTLTYRRDGLDYLDRPRQIWVSARDDATGGVRITDGDIDHESVRWHPTDDLLVFTAAGHDQRRDDLRTDVWVCRADGSDRRPVTHGMSANAAQFSADGTTVVFTGVPIDGSGRGVVARNSSLWSVPVDGSRAPVRLTDEETHHAGGPIYATDDGVLFLNESRGAIDLLLVPYDGTTSRALMTGHRQISGVAMAGGRIVVTVSDPVTWGELVLREPDSSERVVSSFNEAYHTSIFPMSEVTATAADGYPVHGWLVRPGGDGPHPLLLLIHGGPFAQYGWHLFDEAQVYAGAGYAVLMANPRGSSGYGQAHGRAILGNVGEVSSSDLMAIFDHVLKSDDTLDGSRAGVLGGSHGGFMTTWIAAHEGHRFRAAVSERAVNAIDSFTGSSDIGWFFADDLYGPDVIGQRRQTPLSYVNDIDIPMLIIHSEEDWRCPIEQAQRLFVAMRKRGAAAEMLIFPGEGHEMSRSGLPSHRLARFEAILEWFERHLR